MGVFEDAVINAKSAAVSVGKEAGRIVDISMLRIDAADIQKDISKKFESLGRSVYDSVKSGNAAGISFDENIEAIDGLYQKLDEVNEKINVLRRKTACPSCGFRNDEKAQFCSRCGAKLDRKQPADTSSSEEKNMDNDTSI